MNIRRNRIPVSRTPQGVRGLKFEMFLCEKKLLLSHPARGAWIEIGYTYTGSGTPPGRTPQGVRGLKYWVGAGDARTLGRTPQGVRGLKYFRKERCWQISLSHPARGAWIEI